jgi:hypothetical protein
VSVSDAKILANIVPFATEEKKDMGFEYHEKVVLSKAKAKQITLTHWSFEDKQYRGWVVCCVT